MSNADTGGNDNSPKGWWHKVGGTSTEELLTWAEVDLDAVAHNIAQVKAWVGPGVEFMAVVKADAYGHGAVEVGRIALECGAAYLGVVSVEEAVELRRAGVTAPVLLLRGITPAQAKQVAAHEITATVYSLELAQALEGEGRNAGKRVKVHLEVDTGMGRSGVLPQDAADLAAEICRSPWLELEGIYTHYSAAEGDDQYTEEQVGKFLWAVSQVEGRGIRLKYRHTSNSAAAVAFPRTHLDMVRPGLLMYGILPREDPSGRLDLRPVLSWKARVTSLKQVPAAYSIGYERTYRTARPTLVATIPVGYADGLSRRLSNQGEVLVGGKRAPIIGLVCMDACMLDVTDIPGVKVGDEVVIIGRQGDDYMGAREMAARLGTTVVDVLSGIGPRVFRLYEKGSRCCKLVGPLD